MLVVTGRGLYDDKGILGGHYDLYNVFYPTK